MSARLGPGRRCWDARWLLQLVQAPCGDAQLVIGGVEADRWPAAADGGGSRSSSWSGIPTAAAVAAAVAAFDTFGCHAVAVVTYHEWAASWTPSSSAGVEGSCAICMLPAERTRHLSASGRHASSPDATCPPSWSHTLFLESQPLSSFPSAYRLLVFQSLDPLPLGLFSWGDAAAQTGEPSGVAANKSWVTTPGHAEFCPL